MFNSPLSQFEAFVFPTVWILSLSCVMPSSSATVLRIKSKNGNVTTPAPPFAQYTHLLLSIKYLYAADWVPGLFQVFLSSKLFSAPYLSSRAVTVFLLRSPFTNGGEAAQVG